MSCLVMGTAACHLTPTLLTPSQEEEGRTMISSHEMSGSIRLLISEATLPSVIRK